MNAPVIADRAVPPLVGELPPQCRKDVDTLRRVVHATLAQGAPAAAVSPNDFQEVFLTGATGFVGRFMLRELLRQNDQLIVHCLVRAESTEHGFVRLREALEHAEVWEDAFAPRLRVVLGDISEERFGLSKAEFAGLSQRIDAVYHVASNVGLVLSYADIREQNALGLRSVLELCLSTRYKHLFYASTMGIFPEYFCNFEREYGGSRIEDEMPPDGRRDEENLPARRYRLPVEQAGGRARRAVRESGRVFRSQSFACRKWGCPVRGIRSQTNFLCAFLPRRFSWKRYRRVSP